MNLLAAFEENLLAQKLIVPGERVFVACSGGPDSVALFHLLRSLTPAWKLRLGMLHLNHQLRGRAAARDERFVRELAARHRVPFYGARATIRKRLFSKAVSPEESAREARYGFFIRTAKRHKIPKIALAHTRNDQAETVLMRILQGTGLMGLRGIRRRWIREKVTLVRPLLDFSREQILQYLQERQYPYQWDESNASTRYIRNRIRLQLLPRLGKDYNPNIIATLARIPEIVDGENQLLAEVENAAWRRAFKRKNRKRLELDRGFFLKTPPSLQYRILGRALRELDRQSGLSFEAWKRLKTHLGRRRYRCSLPRAIDLALTPLKLSVYKNPRKG